MGEKKSYKHLSPLPWHGINFNPGTGFLSLVCVMFCVVSGCGPDIVLTTHSGRPVIVFLSSALVHSLLLLYRHLVQGYLGCKSQRCKCYFGGRYITKEKERKKFLQEKGNDEK